MSAEELVILLRAFAALDEGTRAEVLDALERPDLWEGGKRAQGFLNLVDSCGVYVEAAP